jgi:sodium transport system ATP-binding protein
MEETASCGEEKVLLRACGLRKEYPRVVAVDHLDLHVGRGEVVGLLGTNGAGKTTALRMMAAILTPTHGHVEVCGHNSVTDPLKVRGCLGFLSGDTALYRRLTPRELLNYFGELHGMSPKAITERTEFLIERLDIGDFADRQCQNLSSGQRQRTSIARTLMHDPPLLILDEPTNALDVVSGRTIIDAIRHARNEGRGVIFSTHVMSEAEYLCDRIYVINQGRIHAHGTIDELRSKTDGDNLTEIFLNLIGEPLTQ